MEYNSDKSVSLFDRKRLSSRLMGDEELVTQILQACVPELNANFLDFVKALDSGRTKEAILSIHAMKGSAQNADLTALARLTLEMETALRSGKEHFSQEAIDALEQLLLDTIGEVRRYLGSEN